MNSNLRSNHGIQINPVVTIIFHMYLCSLYLCLIIYLCFNFSSYHYYYYYYYYHYYYYFFTLGVMLFSDKKCHNSRGQPVVSGIVAIFSFFHFISNYFVFFSLRIILVVLSLISLSISQSALLLFLMPLLLPN